MDNKYGWREELTEEQHLMANKIFNGIISDVLDNLIEEQKDLLDYFNNINNWPEEFNFNQQSKSVTENVEEFLILIKLKPRNSDYKIFNIIEDSLKIELKTFNEELNWQLNNYINNNQAIQMADKRYKVIKLLSWLQDFILENLFEEYNSKNI